MKRTDMRRALTLTIPVMMGYVPLGMVFGFLLVQAGAQWWLAPLMSLFVFAGAAQFLAIGFLAAGASIAEITFAVAIVNLRHIFYGISLGDILPKRLLSRIYFISALTDENYSILTGTDKEMAEKYSILIAGVNHFYWVASAMAGALLGKVIDTNINGIEFSLTALFTVLAVEQYRRLNIPLYPLVAVGTYWAALQVAPANPLFLAICAASAAILVAAPLKRILFSGTGKHMKETI